MNSEIEKIFGYVLLCIGLFCILFSFRSMYDVFTNKTDPPEIFQLQSVSFSASSGIADQSTSITMALDPQMRKVVNVFLYYLFMFFILMAGSKVSGLGIQFIKDVKVTPTKEEA
jgi:hypothetical protein